MGKIQEDSHYLPECLILRVLQDLPLLGISAQMQSGEYRE